MNGASPSKTLAATPLERPMLRNTRGPARGITSGRRTRLNDRQPLVPTEATRSRERLTFTPVGELLKKIKPIPFAIRGVLEQDSLTLLVGQPGTAKSFVSLDWACSVATGTEWQGYEVKQGRVLYIAGEGQNGIRNRLRGWELAHNVSLKEAPLSVSDCAVPLDAEGFRAVLDAINEQPEMPDLIIVDTLARSFAGDENSSKDMGAFVAAMDEFRRLTGATILVVHHTGWSVSDRGRGSSALLGAADRQWLAKKEKNNDFALTCLKVKDSELPLPIRLRLEQVPLRVTDEYGDELTTAVLRAATALDPNTNSLGKNQEQAMEALLRLSGQICAEGEVMEKITTAQWRKESGLDRRRFPEVKRSLIETNRVVLEGIYVSIGAT